MHRAHYACASAWRPLCPRSSVQRRRGRLKKRQTAGDQGLMRLSGSAHARPIRRAGVGALLAAALLLILPVASASADAPCADSGLQPSAANLPQVEAATLCLINVQRAQNGLAALTANSVLQSAALQHSQDMVNNN